MSHTPGPWVWEYDENESGHIVWLDDEANHHDYETHLRWICEHGIWPPASDAETKQFAECEANARLIAAAPELLAACELVDLHFTRNKHSGAFQGDDEHEAWNAVALAIKKACG